MKDIEKFSDPMQCKDIGVLVLAEGKDGKFELPKKIQLMRTGQFFRLWSDGEIAYEIKLNEEMLDNMLKNHIDGVTGVDLAIDYSHYAGEKAAAWIKNLQKVESKEFPGEFELTCEPKWTAAGVESVGGGEFRYFSVEIHPNYRDNQNLDYFGPTLLGAGLTNRPFIKGMQPTSKLSDIKKENEVKEKLEKLQEEMKGKITEVETLTAEIKSLTEGSSKLSEENKTLTETNTKLSEEKANLEKEAKFNVMLSDGKVCPAQKEAFMSDNFSDFAEKAQDKLNLNENGTGKGAEETNLSDADDKLIADANALCAKEEGLEFADAVIRIQKESK